MKDNKELKGANRYEKIRDLKAGSFGFVQLARDKKTGNQVAIKFIERGDKINKHVQHEITNHKLLLHHHVIQFKEVYLIPDYLCIAMEYAPGGDMLEYVKQKKGLSEDEARWFFQQLIIGLDYCHQMGVANRDIKLENTLLDGSTWPLLKICDFGYSKHDILNSAPESRVGTPAYLAPEVIMNPPGQIYNGKIADIWSCGVFLYVMMVAEYPFERSNVARARDRLQKMIERIVRVDYSIPEYIGMSDDCKDLIKSLLCKDVDKRIDIPSIMQHRWFKKNLPQGAEKMNMSLRKKTGGQSEAEIEAIVLEAKTKATIRDIDATIDAYIENLSETSSLA